LQLGGTDLYCHSEPPLTSGIMLYHKLHWGATGGGRIFTGGAAVPWPPSFEPSMYVYVTGLDKRRTTGATSGGLQVAMHHIWQLCQFYFLSTARRQSKCLTFYCCLLWLLIAPNDLAVNCSRLYTALCVSKAVQICIIVSCLYSLYIVGLRTLDFLCDSVHRIIKFRRGLCSCLIVYTILCLCVLIVYLCLSRIVAEQAERKIGEGRGPFLLLQPEAADQGASCQNGGGGRVTVCHKGLGRKALRWGSGSIYLLDTMSGRALSRRALVRGESFVRTPTTTCRPHGRLI